MPELYNKPDVTNLADKTYEFFKGLRDGWSNDDLMRLVETMTAAPAATNELKDDFDAAILHIISRVGDRLGDDRVDTGGE